jgi:antimicrobial peptide system SdpB family protein
VNANVTPTREPWTNVVGCARTVLALGTLLTLVTNRADLLFRPLDGSLREVSSVMLVSRYSLFTLFGDPYFEWGRRIAIVILALVASGWRPRLTGILHWYVAASFAASCVVVDGGDQVAAVLSLLLVPVTLTDGRRWHWAAPSPATVEAGAWPELRAFIARSALWMIRLQVAAIYLQACVAKLSVPEWKDGTACYYWFTNPLIGMPHALERFLVPLLSKPLGVVAFTWGTLLLEMLLFSALFMDKRWRRPLLIAALVFHAGIIVIHGLVTFFCSMAAAAVLYLRPIDQPFSWWHPLAARWRWPRLARRVELAGSAQPS